MGNKWYESVTTQNDLKLYRKRIEEFSQYSDEDKKILGELHYKRIDISDAIYVINVDGYIGESTKKEIEYAKKLGKEILYLED